MMPFQHPAKLGGPNGNRTRLCAVTGRYTNRYTIGPKLERVERIELSTKPWQGFVLPLNHTRMVEMTRIELAT